MNDVDEKLINKEWSTPCYITFYTAKGYAIRETMYSERNHMDKILHRQANKKAKELGAHHWAVFKHWTGFDVDYTEEELENLYEG